MTIERVGFAPRIGRAFRRAVRRHPDAATAAAILGLTVLLAAVGVRGIFDLFALPSARGLSPWWHLAVVVPGCALVLVKRRAPHVALAAGTVLLLLDVVLLGGTVGMLLVVLDLLYTATETAAPPVRRVLLVLLVSAAAVAAGAAALRTGRADVTVFVGIQVLALLGSSYWWASAVARQTEIADLHRQRAADAARLAELREAEAVRIERGRLAAELHDVVAGHVGAVALRTEAALVGTHSADSDRVALRRIRESSLAAHDALRSMIDVLRAGDLPVQSPSLRSDLASLVDEARRGGSHVTVTGLQPAGLPDAADRTAALVVREALNNAGRHAPGSDVEVAVTSDGGILRLEVVSRGGRTSPTAGPGLGLRLMQERISSAVGRLEAGPIPNEPGTWRVVAAIPIGGDP